MHSRETSQTLQANLALWREQPSIFIKRAFLGPLQVLWRQIGHHLLHRLAEYYIELGELLGMFLGNVQLHFIVKSDSGA
jgi:hypothetical protein